VSLIPQPLRRSLQLPSSRFPLDASATASSEWSGTPLSASGFQRYSQGPAKDALGLTRLIIQNCNRDCAQVGGAEVPEVSSLHTLAMGHAESPIDSTARSFESVNVNICFRLAGTVFALCSHCVSALIASSPSPAHDTDASPPPSPDACEPTPNSETSHWLQ
jgi:hypothetical protein